LYLILKIPLTFVPLKIKAAQLHMKKLSLVFAVVGLLFTASCGKEKVDQEATEVEILEEESEEILQDTIEIMEEDSVEIAGDSVAVAL
jgi:outer membrane murein-binding lipoprotein Lpp